MMVSFKVDKVGSLMVMKGRCKLPKVLKNRKIGEGELTVLPNASKSLLLQRTAPTGSKEVEKAQVNLRFVSTY